MIVQNSGCCPLCISSWRAHTNWSLSKGSQVSVGSDKTRVFRYWWMQPCYFEDELIKPAMNEFLADNSIVTPDYPFYLPPDIVPVSPFCLQTENQTETRHQSMKSLWIEISHVDRYRLPGWSSCDYRNQWLHILNDMIQNRFQCCLCIHSLFSLKF